MNHRFLGSPAVSLVSPPRVFLKTLSPSAWEDQTKSGRKPKPLCVCSGFPKPFSFWQPPQFLQVPDHAGDLRRVVEQTIFPESLSL